MTAPAHATVHQPVGERSPRRDLWERCGAQCDDREALRAYAAPAFGAMIDVPVPLGDEPHVAIWKDWVHLSERAGAPAVLRAQLPQLRFSIAEATRHQPEWHAATRRGLWSDQRHTGPDFADPAGVTLAIATSLAGAVPLIVARDRRDFEYLLRALTARCAPVPVAPSCGATMVAGFVNWSRVHRARSEWASARGGDDPTAWLAVFERLKQHPAAWQDRFILLSGGPYAAVPASELELADSEWLAASIVVRREHEVAHYVTKRFFGVMRNALHDEVLADYAGLVAAFGHYDAARGRRVLGLDERGCLLDGGRLWNYRGTPALSDRAMQALASLAAFAIDAVARLDLQRIDDEDVTIPLAARTAALIALASTSLESMAGPDGANALRSAYTGARQRLGAATSRA